jgi:hypothetical protein
MIGARKIERRPYQLASQSSPFERRGHFGMDKVDAVGEPAVSQYRAKTIELHFEPVRLLVMDYGDVVEIYFHEYPTFSPDRASLTGIRKIYGVGESGGSMLKRRASSAWSITTAGSRWIAAKYFFWKPSPESVGTNIFLARE